MMNVIRVVCLVIFCAICLAGAAHADNVYVTTEVIHYDWNGHNEMLGVAWANVDDSTAYWYCGSMEGDLSRKEDDVEVDGKHGWGTNVCPGLTYSVEISLPFVATSSYEFQASPGLVIFFQDEDGYYDASDYSYYTAFADEGLPIFYPLSYPFFGGSVPQHTNISNLVLGFLNSFWEAGATAESKDPHHLKVRNDVYTSATCIAKKRETTYEIVDIDGKKVGDTPHREFFTLSGIQCLSQSDLPQPTACFRSISGGKADLNKKNPFTDIQTAGCSHTESGDCGFKHDPHTWVWCQSTNQLAVFTHTTLASTPGDVRVSKILLKGQEATYAKGTEFRP